MARGRMISKSISTSVKFGALTDTAGDLAEFAQLLFPLLVVHADDFGRLQGDAYTVKLRCFPMSPRPVPDFDAALQYLSGVGLISRYVYGANTYIQVQQFDAHQIGLHHRTRSIIPDVSGKFPEHPGTAGKVPEHSGNSRKKPRNRIEENRSTYPPKSPLLRKGDFIRLTRRDLAEAATIRSRSYGGCPHAPSCKNANDCVALIAKTRKQQPANGQKGKR